MSTETIRQYCGTCCDCAKKAGREVRQTSIYKYPICPLCESRMREGLIHYQPSNGTEFRMFEARCGECRFYDDHCYESHTVKACAYGIMDKLLNGMAEERDSMCFWFDPGDIESTCPATCKRFEKRMPNDGDGPAKLPTPDCPGQMTFDDLNVPVERVPKDLRVWAGAVSE